jgi:HAD superfamily hydrolase (TIGR01549 family)
MPLDIPRIQAILFDIDGTLSDTDDQWASRMERFLRPMRFLFPGHSTRHIARRLIMALETPTNSVYTLLDRLSLDADVFRLLQWISRIGRPKTPQKFWIIPGAIELLENLHARFPLAVVSARDAASTHRFLEQFQISSCFQAVATSQTCRYTKPFPDPVIWAARQLGVAPEHCLMVGDTTVDVRAGRSAGAQTVGVLCGFGMEDELRRAGADEILPSTARLDDLF